MIESYGGMDDTAIELLVKRSLLYANPLCTFAFQGGEPTIAGLDFFRKLVEYVRFYNTKKIQINFALQTNGTLIDQGWATFLAKNNFLVGLSLDGPKDVHDRTRLDAGNKGTFLRVMETVDLFEKHKVEYNILCVVNSYVAEEISKVYKFFRKRDFNYLQFIPCLDPLGEAPGNYPYSLTPDKYAFFLKTLFDLWYHDLSRGNMISVRYFDNLVMMLTGYPPESCGIIGICQPYFVIEANGEVFPCDFYCTDQWRLGNIFKTDFDKIRKSERMRKFTEASKYVDPACSGCKWRQLCRGGCRRNREPFNDGRPVLNYYCGAFKEFFAYTEQRLVIIANNFRHKG